VHVVEFELVYYQLAKVYLEIYFLFDLWVSFNLICLIRWLNEF